MEKFKNKYRIQSTRLQHWDYRWDATYFITICTKNREFFFGEIHDNIMQLTPVGAIADVLWHEIKNHAKNVELDAFIVMPNHIHGILILNGNHCENPDDTNGVTNDDITNDSINDINNDINNVETGHALSLHALSLRSTPRSTPPSTNKTAKTIGQQRFQNIGKNSVSSIIGSYKSAVTKHANRLGMDFEWQSRFHDHIIRDNREYNRIQQYIINNPLNWKEDKFYE